MRINLPRLDDVHCRATSFAKIKQEEREERESIVFKKNPCALCHVRTVFTVALVCPRYQIRTMDLVLLKKNSSFSSLSSCLFLGGWNAARL
jgi:hypothetical protein